MALAGMTQEQTNEENRNTCKRISEELEAYASGEMYRCPECGEVFKLYDEYGENFYIDEDENEIGKCPHCGFTSENENDFEPQSLYDYFADCLDIEFRVSGKNADEINSVQIMVTCGGPNIYINTASKQVELYWWLDRAHYPISYDAITAVEEWAQEYWDCM